MHIEASRSTFKLHLFACLIIFSLIVPGTLAADVQSDKDQKATNARASSSSNPDSDSSSKTDRSQEQRDAQSGRSNGPQSGPSSPTNSSSSSSTNAVSPLSPSQKFKYFARSSFMPPMPYALSVLYGVFSEATDKDHGRHMTAGDFMADSMTHAARAFAFRTTANFFEKFAFASAFKQDPRYHRSDKKGFARIGYAVGRVFVTQSDSGHDQFNASFFAGGLVAAGISNAWVRPEDQTVSSTLSRFGVHVGYKALSNIIQELFGKH